MPTIGPVTLPAPPSSGSSSEPALQRERLTALGSLVAATAHEINNPLAVLVANLDYAREELQRDPAHPPPGELMQALAEAAEGADRVRRIVRDLLTLTRHGGERGAIDLVEVVQATLRAAEPVLRKKARVLADCQPVPQVMGGRAELGQAVLALLLNAAEALEAGAAERNQIHVSTAQRAGEVLVCVRDSGRGAFTTRAAGDGIGLALCNATVSALGGRIEVEGADAQGTTLRIVLPRGTLG